MTLPLPWLKISHSGFCFVALAAYCSGFFNKFSYLLTPRVSTLAFFRIFNSAAFILERIDWLGLIFPSSSSSSFPPFSGSDSLAFFADVSSVDRVAVRVITLCRDGGGSGALWLEASVEFSQKELCDRNWEGSWMWESSLKIEKFD